MAQAGSASQASPAPDSAWPIALIALAAALVLALAAPAMQLFDRDETLYARAAAEMISGGNWLLPSFNGETFGHKPPLIYWLMAVSRLIFGPGEFGVRFPSVLGLAGTVLVTGLISQRLFGARAGLWAAAMLPVSLMAFYLGAAAMLDAVLTFFITLALWAYVQIVWKSRPVLPMLVVFFLALALGQLTKGPVAPAVVGLAIASTLIFLPRADRPSFAVLAGLVFAAALSFGVFLAWVIPANSQSGGAIWQVGFMTHVLGRALAPMEGHGGSGLSGYLSTLLVYVPVVLIGMFPWLGHLLGALAGLWRGEIGTRRDRVFIWSWAAPTFLMFTLAATKLPHYIFPVFPALAIALSGLMTTEISAGTRRIVSIGAWLQLAGSIATILLIAALPALLPGSLSWGPALAVAAISAASLYWTMSRFAAGDFAGSTRFAIPATAVFWLALFWVIVPALEPMFKISKPLAAAIRQSTPAGAPVFALGYAEPSLMAYLDLPAQDKIRVLPHDSAAAAQVLAGEPVFILVATEEKLAEIEKLLAAPLRRSGEWRARNLNAGGRLQTIILASRGLAQGQ